MFSLLSELRRVRTNKAQGMEGQKGPCGNPMPPEGKPGAELSGGFASGCSCSAGYAVGS